MIREVVSASVFVLGLSVALIVGCEEASKGVSKNNAPPKEAITAAVAKDFVFRGLKFGYPLDQQDTSLEFTDTKFIDGFYEVRGLKFLGPGYFRLNDWVWLDPDRNVGGFLMHFDREKADDLEAMLTEKYGKPASTTKSTMQNSFGAVFDTYETTWQVKNVIIELKSLVKTDIRSGSLSVATQKMREAWAKKATEEKKDRMGNL